MSATTKAKPADWEKVGLPRWYDCKLGTMKDRALARLTGVSLPTIRHRRRQLGIPAWTIAQVIAPFTHLLGVSSDAEIGRLSGASPASVRTYRESLAIPARQRPQPAPRIPMSHPVKPFSALLGLVDDQALGRLAGVSADSVTSLREMLKVDPAKPLPPVSADPAQKDFQGPWLGYESMFRSMSDAKISRATGVPFPIVQARRIFLGIEPYQRRSRLAPYEHLLGVVSNNLLAKLVGLSPARIYLIRKSKETKSA